MLHLKRCITQFIYAIALVADITAGGCPGDKPIWQVSKNALLSRLDSAYEIMMDLRSYPFNTTYSGSQNRKVRLLEFPSTNTPSEPHGNYPGLNNCKCKLLGFRKFSSADACSILHRLLLDDNDTLSIALNWAVEKLKESAGRPRSAKQNWLVSNLYALK